MSSRSNRPPVFWWALAAITLGWYALFAAFPDAFFRLGVDHFEAWFLDTFAILASNDAVTRGLDPYAPNPLDYFQREHVYSHWWLQLRHLGLTRAQSFALGLSLSLGFVTAALCWLRPRERGEVAWYLAVLGSSPFLLALDRANNDLVIFLVLSAVIPCLLSQRAAIRWLAIGPVAIAAGLKYYPAAAALLLLGAANARETRGRVALAAVVLGLVAIDVAPDLGRMRSLVPQADGLMTFSAFNLLGFLGVSDRMAVWLGFALAGIAAFGFTRLRIFSGWQIAGADRAWLGFVLGASLLLGCFLTGRNHAYRWIFALWLAPLLWRLPRDPATPRLVRRLAGITAVLLIYVLWADSLASFVLTLFVGRVPPMTIEGWSEQFFRFEQPIVWMFFWCLLGFLTHFVMQAWAQIRSDPPAARPGDRLARAALH